MTADAETTRCYAEFISFWANWAAESADPAVSETVERVARVILNAGQTEGADVIPFPRAVKLTAGS